MKSLCTQVPLLNSFLEENLRCSLHTEQNNPLVPVEETKHSFRCSFCGNVYIENEGIFEMIHNETLSTLGDFFSVEKKQWDEYAKTYDMKREKDIDYMNCIYAAVRRISLASRNNQIVLDVGCGTGIGTRQLLCQNRINGGGG